MGVGGRICLLFTWSFSKTPVPGSYPTATVSLSGGIAQVSLCFKAPCVILINKKCQEEGAKHPQRSEKWGKPENKSDSLRRKPRWIRI